MPPSVARELGGHIRPETEAVRMEEMIELVQHHPGADAHDAPLGVKIQNLAVMPRKIHDQAFANRAAAQAGARAARNHRHARHQRRLDDVRRPA